MSDEPKAVNLAALNGEDPAEPESEEDRDKWLQGDLDRQERKAEQAKELSKEKAAFFSGQTDDERTAKPSRVSNAHPAGKSDAKPASSSTHKSASSSSK